MLEKARALRSLLMPSGDSIEREVGMGFCELPPGNDQQRLASGKSSDDSYDRNTADRLWRKIQSLLSADSELTH